MARKDRKDASGNAGAPPESNDGSNIDSAGLPGAVGQNDGVPTPLGTETAIDPGTAEAAGAGTATSGRSRRTRKSGNISDIRDARNSAKKERSKEAAKDLSVLIASTHYVLATITRCAELEVTEEQAVKLGEALQRVNDLYDGHVLSPKAAALANLTLVAGGTYVPMIFSVINKNKKEKQQPKIVELRNVPAEGPQG